MRTFKRISAAIICVAVMITFITPMAESLNLKLVNVSEAKNKMSEVLVKVVTSADPKTRIPVYIFRNMLSEDDVAGLIAEETSKDSTGKITLSKKELSSRVKIIKTEMENDTGKYLDLRRELVKESYMTSNQTFIKNNNISQSDVVYSSEYTSTVIVNATPNQIYRYAVSGDVENIGFFDDAEQIEDMDTAEIQINDDGDGPISKKYNHGIGYTGKDVTVGIIEAKGGKYDPEAPHLKDIPETQLRYIPTIRKDGTEVESVISDHATKVVSIVVGQSAAVGGKTYRGIAPDATVYQTSIRKTSDVYYAFNLLADMGVNIINYSGGTETTGYDEYDREIDRLVNSTKIVFVKSAGNTGDEITSPGKGVNVITVGNLETKDSEFNALSAPFLVRGTSAYNESAHLSNKPDLVAPGTNIVTAYDSRKISYGTGTSYSAPIVAGVIAQMMERVPMLKGDPCRLKSLLISFCDDSEISEEDNPTVGCEYIREKTGAGLIDASQMLLGFTHATGLLMKKGSKYSYTINIEKGTTIKIVLAVFKANNKFLTRITTLDNLDITLTDSKGKIVAASDSDTGSLEIIRYTAENAGKYTLTVSAASVAETSVGVPYGISWRIVR